VPKNPVIFGERRSAQILALDGELRVQTPAGEGTVVAATLPVLHSKAA
jgi:hypothetical protein